MKTCSKCGFQNTDDSKKCTNCLVDLHWAKVNLGKFTGTLDDTKRIGEEERKHRGIKSENSESINSTFTEAPSKPKTNISNSRKWWLIILGILVDMWRNNNSGT